MLLALPLFKDKASENLYKAIQQAKTVSFDRFIFALGIPFVGEEAARIYARSFTEISQWINTDYQTLIDIHGIGEKTASSTITWLSDDIHKEELIRLIDILDIQSTTNKNDNILDGKRFVITGTFDNYSRTELADLIRQYGGKVTG
jgi:DNA ligase (NAD+)